MRPYVRTTWEGRAPVVMCTWKRIERVPETLQLLGEQSAPASLYVWNNNAREKERLDALLARSPVPVESVHSSRNIGPLGRFYLARELAETHETVLFIDDDQEFGPSMVSDQLESFAPRSLAGWWAFNYRPGARSYAERDRVEGRFEAADYVGVGGMVADSSLFRDPELFRCPRRYWFVDDMWLSYIAATRGWSLRRSAGEFSFVSDGDDLDQTLVMTKIRMFRHLKRRGWQVAGAER